MATHFLLRRGDALTPSELAAATPGSPSVSGGSVRGSADGGLASPASFYFNPSAGSQVMRAPAENDVGSGADSVDGQD